MELYKVKIPLDSIDVITGSTVVSGVTVQTGYVELTKTGDTYVDIFLTSDYDDMGIYTDFDIKEILQFNTTIPVVEYPTTSSDGSIDTSSDGVTGGDAGGSALDAPVDDGEFTTGDVSDAEGSVGAVGLGSPTGGSTPGGDPLGDLGGGDTGGLDELEDDGSSLDPDDIGDLGGDLSEGDLGADDLGVTAITTPVVPECKTGKLQIATHTVPESGYTGSTAYVMATSDCNTWTVTGTTSNNMMEILPIAGINQLATNVHSQYDANENPIEVTLIYGSVANNTQSGATYNIGTGDTKISYNTTDISSLDTNFSFKRECCEECYGLNTKEEMKMGWVFDPKINVNVFIDRGQNSIFDKFLRLSEVSNNDELLDYNNNYFKVDKQQV